MFFFFSIFNVRICLILLINKFPVWMTCFSGSYLTYQHSWHTNILLLLFIFSRCYFWRMVAHKFVDQSTELDNQQRGLKTKKSWWPFGWLVFLLFIYVAWLTFWVIKCHHLSRGGSTKDENEPRGFTEEDWEQLNRIIGYKEGSDENLLTAYDKGDLLHVLFEINMKHNASKLVTDNQVYLADLSCEGLHCSIKSYLETKVFNLKLGSYRLSSPSGLLAEVRCSICYMRFIL